jgi:hypothetical protein
MGRTQGVVQIHSAPSALLPHVEWAVAGAVGVPVRFRWDDQPAERGTRRAEYSWSGQVGTAARIASSLKGWQKIRFEVTEEPTADSDGVRYAYTPTLGVFTAVMGRHGDVYVHEDRLKKALAAAVLGAQPLEAALEDLLGTRWDAELEIFRHAGDGAPVRWLHHVV